MVDSMHSRLAAIDSPADLRKFAEGDLPGSRANCANT
jgi:hypothetical protein